MLHEDRMVMEARLECSRCLLPSVRFLPKPCISDPHPRESLAAVGAVASLVIVTLHIFASTVSGRRGFDAL